MAGYCRPPVCCTLSTLSTLSTPSTLCAPSLCNLGNPNTLSTLSNPRYHGKRRTKSVEGLKGLSRGDEAPMKGYSTGTPARGTQRVAQLRVLRGYPS
jgi:hypothetical protein